jgi:arylsulfatase A-like enzyme
VTALHRPGCGAPLSGLASRAQNQLFRAALEAFFLPAWCGLVAGLLEVGIRVGARAANPIGRLYLLSRHFLWAAPLSNLLLFVLVGLALSLATRLSPRIGGWMRPRLLCALTLLPALIAASPKIYPEAWSVLALGLAITFVPAIFRFASRALSILSWTLPALGAVVALLAAWLYLNDWIKREREKNRAMPSPGAANILLVVLDTVRADHLSAYGYQRRTTPNIDRLASRGIRFDEARAAAPWTLPSHATMFTGRWPHELVTDWLTPISRKGLTLAEYLGACGYATAGFVGNVAYCSYDTGLGRGFTHYEDYTLNGLSVLRTAGLVDYLVRTTYRLSQGFPSSPLGWLGNAVARWFALDERKSAASVNQEFVSWLAQRPSPARPFFGFLNYIDAHASYIPPPGATHRFGSFPRTGDEMRIVYQQWPLLDKTRLSRSLVALGRDSYDDCLGYIDDQLGLLLDELERRGLLDRTLVIVTSDHGEGFGEHDLFDHGESLYRTEVRVPLIIVPPGNLRRPLVVRRTVSLRDLPATVVDLVGLAARSPFGGKSLAGLWIEDSTRPASLENDSVISELAAPNPINPNHGRSPAYRGPLFSITDGDFTYIRNEKDGSEELYNAHDDPLELMNRANHKDYQSIVNRFRSVYNRSRGDGRAGAP